MARKTTLDEDLATLAREDRSRLETLPTAEQLIAYGEGRLSEAESEKIRDLLAVDPEWASLYLDLQRLSETASDEPSGSSPFPKPSVDAAWSDFKSRIEGGGSDASPSRTAVPVGGRRTRDQRRPMVLALAASIVLAAGLGWWMLVQETGPAGKEEGPRSAFHQVTVSDERFRDGQIEIPEDAAGLMFVIDLPSQVTVSVELVDAKGTVVASQSGIEPDRGSIRFKVPMDVLEERAYRLTVRPVEATSGDPPFVDEGFQITFGPPGRPICDRLDARLDAAGVLSDEGSPVEAKALYENSLAQTRLGQCLLEEARAHNGIGLLASKAGRLKESVERFDRGSRALADARRVTLDHDALRRAQLDDLEATIAFNRGMAYFRLGWVEDARDAVVRVRGLQRANGTKPRDAADTLVLSARVARMAGDPHQAAQEIRQALEVLEESPKLRATLWQERARLDLDAGRLDEAEAALSKAAAALEGLDHPSAQANVVADIAELRMRQGRWLECLEQADRTLALRGENEDLNLDVHVRYLRSVALSNLDELDAAERSIDTGLDLLEAARASWRDLGLQFFAGRTTYYHHRLDLAVAQDDSEDVWNVFESFRARGLLESLAVRAAAEPDPREEALRRKILGAIRQREAWDPETGDEVREWREARFRALRRELRDLVSRNSGSPRQGPSTEIDPEQAAELLGSGTLALVFIGGVDRIHALTLDATRGLRRIPLAIPRDRLAAEVSTLLDSLDPRSPPVVRSRLDPTVDVLSRALLAPLGDGLSLAQRLVIVADEPLDHLPFEILRVRGRRLIDSHEVVYLPSFSVLANQRLRVQDCPAPPPHLLLAVGDPILTARDPRWPAGKEDPRGSEEAWALDRLAGTATEVQAITDLYPRGEALSLVAGEATRERFLGEVSRHRLVHLASHAITHGEIPERSKIVMSCSAADGSAKELCDLNFVDVAHLELCGQIVVLSACESAGGPSLAAEGVLGLPRAFLQAGASTVVASLWRVPDQGTARLMTAFHRGLRDGMFPAAALRRAKLERIAAGEPRSTWAAFVILGDWLAPTSTFS